VLELHPRYDLPAVQQRDGRAGDPRARRGPRRAIPALAFVTGVLGAAFLASTARIIG